VAVDKELDKGKIHMRLRTSMKKFDVDKEKSEGFSRIEIAHAFERPNRSYLGRYDRFQFPIAEILITMI